VNGELNIQEVREIIQLIDGSSIDEFEYEQDGTKITLKKRKGGDGEPAYVPVQEEKAVFSKPAQAEAKSVETQAPQPSEPSETKKQTDENLHKIVSPMVGTFYSSPSPDDDAYVKVGDKVQPDTVVCIVEAMKLFNEIDADQTGEIVEVLVENGELVEYGQPLFLVKPEGA
jgi:acetyl-CoA carboxylase biotin carboxyl carrier protein